MPCRVRDIGLAVGPLPTGAGNAITDVAGVRVGHTTVWRDEPFVARTGVTVIHPAESPMLSFVTAGGAVLNGAGECTGFIGMQEWGLIETPIFLGSTHAVGRILDAAVELCAVSDDVVIPVVAECDDSFLSSPLPVAIRRDHVASAFDTADTKVTEGCVGAGTGMSCLGFKGGIGTSSRRTPGGYTVGVLAMTNYGSQERLTIGGVGVGRLLAPGRSETPSDAGSSIVIVATDAPLDALTCQRLARRAGLGLARTGSFASHGSGEIFIAFTTGRRIPFDATSVDAPALVNAAVSELFAAVVDATEEAALNSIFMATTVVGRLGHTMLALPIDETVTILRAHGLDVHTP